MAKKKKVEENNIEAFEPDAFVIRTSKKDGSSRNGFSYPQEIGAIVECPDWKATKECDNGLHGCLDGIGNWSLLSSEHDALWWVIGVKREACVDLDGKVKFPRGKVVYFGGINGALNEIAKQWKRIGDEARALAEKSAESCTQDDHAHASTAGRYAHASTAGYSAHASTAGESAHASTAGEHSVSSGLGYNNRAKAAANGAIVLVHRNDFYEIVAIRASKVGENGIKPDTWYELTAEGEFKEVQE